jgi:hypothetical protein
VGKPVSQFIDPDAATLFATQDAEVVQEGRNKLFEYDVVLGGKKHSFMTTRRRIAMLPGKS